MTAEQTKNEIKFSLQAFESSNLTSNALKLFQALGYVTERQAPLNKPTFAEFKDTYIDDKRFDETKAKASEWKYVDLLFQLSKEEVLEQTSLLDTKQVVTRGEDTTIIETYLFFAIELRREQYTRTELSLITREVNRLFPMPAMILFRHGNTLTLSVINRRLHKRDESKDVLEKVTQIKDINIAEPHRAHIEILFDLSFDELKEKHQFTNFVELHNAWQKTLDTKELNKKFFQELANWYFWAMDNVEFPDDIEKNKEIRNATNLIRLITRVIFIWFIKEKKLVPANLFRKDFLTKAIKDFAKNKKSENYYQAILQNLFFGTLNQKMNERGFVKEGNFQANKTEYGVKNLFRYADKFTISEKEVMVLFKDVPFLNGGLFDCLDKPNEAGTILYVDGFSRNTKRQATVPDYLFFGDETEVDLNEIYATRNKTYKSKGLVNILESYKFTVAENTPIEEEIALDPELLGKVFENLLASYNPETQTTARKQTGSFYTPREIVNHMVDESLLEYLKQNCKENLPDLDNRLRDLFSYSENANPFNEKETKILIEAINNCKILDPACGSGAFPMGVLHKIVHILTKLDNGNKLWRELQKQKAIEETDAAYKGDNKEERQKRLLEINDVFDNNASDYGRKLYLIENCIYGIDIQPIAVQIAKLRFFISLIIDQNKQEGKENFGIRSLPNLETKFVAANSLIGLDRPEQTLLRNIHIEEKEKELKDLRHNYFTAKTRREKIQYQTQDKKLRKEIAKFLEDDGWDTTIAKKIIAFDPYDQNLSAPFFESEWMFGLTDGFDIVIGNPPYIEFKKLPAEEKAKFSNYNSAKGKYDIYVIFDERTNALLKSDGVMCFIQPTTFMKKDFGEAIRKFIKENFKIKIILDFADIQVFEGATNYTGVFLFSKSKLPKNYKFDCHQYLNTGKSISIFDFQNSLVDNTTSPIKNFLEIEDIELDKTEWNFQNDSTNTLLAKFSIDTKPLSEITEEIFQGIASGKDEVFYVNDDTIRDYKIEKGVLKKLLKGKDIKKYVIDWAGYYVIYPYDKNSQALTEATLKSDYPNAFAYLKECKELLKGRDYFDNSPKKWFELWNQRSSENFKVNRIISPEITDRNNFVLTNSYYGNTKTYHIIPKDKSTDHYLFLLGLLNSKLLDFIYKKITTPQAGGFYAYKTQFLSKLPIRAVKQHKPYAEIVSKIVKAKDENPKADISKLEKQLDEMVYKLYELTEEEIAIIENKK